MFRRSLLKSKLPRLLLLVTVIYGLYYTVISRYVDMKRLETNNPKEITDAIEEFAKIPGRYINEIAPKDALDSKPVADKEQILKNADQLMKVPVIKFGQSVDPIELLAKTYRDPADYRILSRDRKADLYAHRILPQSGYEFQPLDEELASKVKDGKKELSEITQEFKKMDDEFTKDELTQLHLTAKDRKKYRYVKAAGEKHFFDSYMDRIKFMFNHLRIFSSIFLKSSAAEQNDKMRHSCLDAESKILPWLTGQFPVFTKLDPTTKYTEVRVYPFGDDPDAEDNKDQVNYGCFIRNMQSRLSGRGIVFTASDEFVDSLLGAISVLRSTEQNPVHIEVFYTKGTLSDESKRRIAERATEKVNGLERWAIPPTMLNKNPQQMDVVFADVTGSLKSEYLGLYRGWGNKLLAYMFNSFEETVMMDTDTVPLVPISTFFGATEYTDTKTFFFRDREMHYKLDRLVINMFRNCEIDDKDKKYLGLKTTGADPLRERLFKSSLKDMMESGLVAINRKKHYDSVVATFMMQMIEPIRAVFHGDKELFWMAEDLMGNPYRFNENPAGSAGQLIPLTVERPWHRVCSTHPCHFSDDAKSLLWINSGFLYCKNQENYKDDVGGEGNDGLDAEGIRRFYNSPVQIRVGVIPPPPGQKVEPEEGYPTKGWEQVSVCHGYLRCANDVLGGPKFADQSVAAKGKFVEFSSNDVEKFDYLANIWVNYATDRSNDV